jgi:D-alanine-D-alanine ligase
MDSRLSLCVLCGGRSAEHEVSLCSAFNVVGAVDRSRFDVCVVGIDKGGQWRLLPDDRFVVGEQSPDTARLAAGGTTVVPTSQDGRLVLLALDGSTTPVDAVFPVMHGTYGEDGAIQGLLRMCGAAFVGCDVMASANCMDKDVAKRLFVQAGIDTAPWQTLELGLPRPSDEDLVGELGLPLFVKPARLGSSVGISKVKTLVELGPAVELAFRYDTKVIVEEFVPGREIEVAVLGNRTPQASVPGEIEVLDEFYSFTAKYIDGSKAKLHAPADLPPEAEQALRDAAVRAFRALDCAGLARVDFFLCADGRVRLNEINTIPGFTRISMYPQLWGKTGVPYPELIGRLVDLALERHAEEAALVTDFQAEA